jgi:hypothetical protein
VNDMNSKIRKKAFGIMKSLESMNADQRSTKPSKSFGENYNRLRNLCASSNPELVELVPPEVDFVTYSTETVVTKHSFFEIHTFCSEIYYLLE